MKKITHTGILRRAGSHCIGNDHWEDLSESPRWWSAKSGNKYRKTTGALINGKFPHWRLDISTIITIDEYNRRKGLMDGINNVK